MTAVMTREERIAAAKQLFTVAAKAALAGAPNAPELVAAALLEVHAARITDRWQNNDK